MDRRRRVLDDQTAAAGEIIHPRPGVGMGGGVLQWWCLSSREIAAGSEGCHPSGELCRVL